MKKVLLLFIVLASFSVSLSAQQNFPVIAEDRYSCFIIQNSTYSNTSFSRNIDVIRDSINSTRFFTYTTNSVKTGTYTMDTVPNAFSYYYSTSNQWGQFSTDSRYGIFKIPSDSLILNTIDASGPPYVSTSRYYKCKKVIPLGLAGNRLKKLQLLPNPAREVLQVKYFNGRLNYSIYNGLGALAKSGALTETNTQLDVGALPNGIYFIQFDQDGVQHTQKFVKE